jgi:glutamate-ammonia-ligase adenylyltransferase
MTSERFVGYDTWGNDEVRQLLAPIGFADPKAADRELRHLLDDPRAGLAWTECLPTLLTALSGTPSPDRALSNFTRFALTASTRPAIVRYLAGHPRGIEVLVTLFGGSQFLTEILLRRPATFDNLIDAHLLASAALAGMPFWTLDRRLAGIASRLGLRLP